MTRPLRVVLAGTAGIALGALATIAIQGGPTQVGDGSVGSAGVAPGGAETFLAWVPRGLPHGFADAVRAMPKIGPVSSLKYSVSFASLSNWRWCVA